MFLSAYYARPITKWRLRAIKINQMKMSKAMRIKKRNCLVKVFNIKLKRRINRKI